jgi:hypothetical protein
MIELREASITVDGEADFKISSVICVDKHGKEHKVPIKRFQVGRVGIIYNHGGNLNVKAHTIGTIAADANATVDVVSSYVSRLICQSVTLTCYRITQCFASKHNAKRTVSLKRVKGNPFESPEREVELHRVLKSYSP